jgi:hypothetical protein
MQGITLELSDEQYCFLEGLAYRNSSDLNGAFRSVLDLTIGRDLLARAFTQAFVYADCPVN